MNFRHRNRPEWTLQVALVLACLFALVPGVAAVNVATGSFQIASVGETVSIPIVLDSASGGISGYRITVTLRDPSVATITAVAFPDWIGLKSASAVPSGSVVLQGVGLSEQISTGATGVPLATLTVKGTAAGSTGIVVAPDPSMGVQDRNGDLYQVSAPPGTLTVGIQQSIIVPTPASTTGVPTEITTVAVPPPSLPVGETPTPIPTSGGSSPVPVSFPVYSVTPVVISEPGAISPQNPISTSAPTVIAPVIQPTFGAGKRYAIGNPGSFIGTRFGSGGAPTDTSAPGEVAEPEATLKPGSRAYGINPPTGKFVRWYPAARWKAGIK